MDTEYINTFLVVAKSPSMTEAAEVLHITQPTLSNRIQILETDLGLRLFVRGKGVRRLELTEAGKAFIPIAEKWQTLCDETRNFSTAPTEPTFVVTSGKTLSTYIMPAVYHRFMSRHLPVQLKCLSTNYQESYLAVESKKADVAFISTTMTSQNVSAIHIANEKMVMVCSKNSSYQGTPHPSQLPADKMIFNMWNYEVSRWHEYWFGYDRHSVYVEGMCLGESILSEPEYWSIVPISVARIMERKGFLHYLELQEPPPSRPLYLLTLMPQHEYTQYIVEDFCKEINANPDYVRNYTPPF